MIPKLLETLFALSIIAKACILEISTLGLWNLAKTNRDIGISKANMQHLKDLTEVGIVYRIGDTVVIAEIDDELSTRCH